MKCFLIEDLHTSRYRLRRYAGEVKCTGPHGYHNALSAPIADRLDDPSKPYHGSNPPAIDYADSRWPKACACSYVFKTDDAWQIFSDGLYRRPDTGEVFPWNEAPAGSICEAFWWPDKGPDGHSWQIKLSDGSDFMTEQSAANCECREKPIPDIHRCWTRTGQAPNLTVSPSIATPRWHGWLRDGILVQA